MTNENRIFAKVINFLDGTSKEFSVTGNGKRKKGEGSDESIFLISDTEISVF